MKNNTFSYAKAVAASSKTDFTILHELNEDKPDIYFTFLRFIGVTPLS